MTAQDWVLIIGALGVLVGTIATAAVTVIKALRDNTVATQQSTMAHTANTTALLSGTGDGGTVVNVTQPASAPPTVTATPAPKV